MMSLTNMVMYIFQNPLPGVEGMKMQITNRRGSLIVSSREDMAGTARLAGATHIMFLDSDMTFPEDALHRLFSRNEPFVAANYVQRSLPTRPNAIGVLGTPKHTKEDSTGIEEVHSTGFGCCLIRMEVFDAIPRPWFDTYWFTNENGGKNLIGEDVYFCHKARHAGYKTYIDHDLSQQVSHIGIFEYTHAMADVSSEWLNEVPLLNEHS